MTPEELSRIGRLVAAGDTPQAKVLVPEVRSGVSFTFDTAAPPGNATWPRFKVVWFFTVKPANRDAFALKVAALESSQAPSDQGVSYLGTYSVTVSSAAPDFEYRMVWGLSDIGALQALNDLLHGAPVALRDCLDLISQDVAIRAEIMGRTAFAASLVT